MTTLETALPPRFDVFDPALERDPYPAYAALRGASAVCRAGPATFALTRYEHVFAALRDHRFGHHPDEEPSRRRAGGGVLDAVRPTDALPTIIAALDPPEHTQIRSLVRRALDDELLARLRARVATACDWLLDTAFERDVIDVVDDIAFPLQGEVATVLLGIPEADRAEVVEHATRLGRAIILVPFVTPERGNGEADARWLREYVAALAKDRARRPGPDLISKLLAVAPRDVAVDNAAFLFFAGFETAVNLVASGMLALASHPDAWARLQADHSLASVAVEETLRYEPPIQWVSRMTKAAVEVPGTGRTLLPGRVVLLLLASANRDPRQFAEPDAFDVGRRPNPHLAFGAGPHHCMGVALARMKGAIVFERLAARCHRIDLRGPAVVRPHPNLRGYARIPCTLTPS